MSKNWSIKEVIGLSELIFPSFVIIFIKKLYFEKKYIRVNLSSLPSIYITQMYYVYWLSICFLYLTEYYRLLQVTTWLPRWKSESESHSVVSTTVYGIFQARILEWVASPFSRGSSRARDETSVSYVSCTGWQILYHSTTWDLPWSPSW